jgi:hypothetical protein
MKEAKNIYTGLKILIMLTNINPLHVSFAIDLLSEQKRFTVSKDNISAHTQRLSVESYERYYETVLVPEVRNQYMINDRNLKELILSPRSRKNQNVYSTCSCCFSGMQPKMIRN